jgi:poly(3-hydroxybutyrate) depolymerase
MMFPHFVSLRNPFVVSLVVRLAPSGRKRLTLLSIPETPRVLMIKGKADIGDPYDGGPHTLSGTVLSAHASAAAFAKQNGLVEMAEEVDVAPMTKLRVWPSSGRPFVALYSIEGLGHMVPVEWRDKQDGTALAWKFFTAP